MTYDHIHEHQVLSTDARAEDNATLFGFWMYLMNDFVFFASLFAVYIVLRGNVFGEVGSDIFNMPLVLAESFALLTSSFTYGLALLAARREHISAVLCWLSITFVLGAAFLSMEVIEFGKLIAAGHGPAASAFLSAYFALIGAHGLHIAAGLIWMGALIVFLARRGLTRFTLRKLMLLGLFWHFLDLIWIFIFAIVYLMGII